MQTAPPEDRRGHIVEQWGQRAVLAVLALFVLLGLFGTWGLATGTVQAEGKGYRLTVRFPTTTRAGLASPWRAVVEHEGGFSDPVEVAVTEDYFSLYDLNGFYPQPSGATTKDGLVVLEFDPPDGDRLVVDFDARAQPDLHSGGAATASVLVDGVPVASVDFVTRVAP